MRAKPSSPLRSCRGRAPAGAGSLAATAKGGPLDWEPLLYLTYGRLPETSESAIAIARLLLAHGADPRATDKNGETAIQVARRRGLDDAADLMQETRHGR